MDNITTEGSCSDENQACLCTSTENSFDNIIGTIEDIIVNEEFQVCY